MDKIEVSNNTLVWKADGNPLLAGLEPLENYPTYTKELVDAYLNNIYIRKQNEKNSMSNLEAQEVLDLSAELGDSSEDFVVEDPSFNEDKAVEELPKDS